MRGDRTFRCYLFFFLSLVGPELSADTSTSRSRAAIYTKQDTVILSRNSAHLDLAEYLAETKTHSLTEHLGVCRYTFGAVGQYVSR